MYFTLKTHCFDEGPLMAWYLILGNWMNCCKREKKGIFVPYIYKYYICCLWKYAVFGLWYLMCTQMQCIMGEKVLSVKVTCAWNRFVSETNIKFHVYALEICLESHCLKKNATCCVLVCKWSMPITDSQFPKNILPLSIFFYFHIILILRNFKQLTSVIILKLTIMPEIISQRMRCSCYCYSLG